MKRALIILTVLQVPLDFFALLGAALTAYVLRFTPWAVAIRPVIFRLGAEDYLALSTIVALVTMIVFVLFRLYSFDSNRKFLQELQKIIVGSVTTLGLIATYILFTQEVFDSRFLVVVGFGLGVVYVCFAHLIMRMVRGILYRLGIGARRVIVIGTGDAATALVRELTRRRELGYTVIGQLATVDAASKTAIMTLRPDEVILLNPRATEAETMEAIDMCNELHITFKYSADLFDTYATRMAVYPLAGVPIIELKRTPLDGWGRVAKRLCDVIVSSLLLVLLCPLMLVIAVIILIETGRPVIYKNERVGLRGRHFFTYKFRSMYQRDSTGVQFGESGMAALAREAELVAKQNTRTGPIYKIGNDPRVTPFGRFIRRWSLDELPQFWNVLVGDMSIVGPRPHQPREVDHYTKGHKAALTLKPGITGLSQISGRSDLPYHEEANLDVFYIEHWNLLLDLIIFLKTPFVVVKKRLVP